jgi:type I restriction enzyme S subunit
MAISKIGDVLMPTSDVTPTGLATASSLDEAGIILGGDILVIRTEKLHSPFLSRAIRKEREQILKLVSGSTVYHIYAKDMAKFEITYPPLPEQQRIAAVLSAQERQVQDIEQLITVEQKRLSWLTEELLSGRVRVEENNDDQDPNDQ